MAAPYSYDLRQKAIEAVKRGERKSDVCRMLKISRNTLDLWLKREEQTGDYRAITNFQKGCRHKIADWERCASICTTTWGQDPSAIGFAVGRGGDTAKYQRCPAKARIEPKKKRMGIENETKASVKHFKSD